MLTPKTLIEEHLFYIEDSFKKASFKIIHIQLTVKNEILVITI